MNFDNLIDSMKSQIINSTQEIIRYKSTEDKTHPEYPYGEAVHKTLLYALDLANSLGFKTKNIDNQVGYAEYGTGSEMIGVLVHLDVVPAGEGWSTDPYAGNIIENKIYGRGTTDDKGPAIASLYAIKALIDSKTTLNKRIRVIFGLNEETHWNSINYYIKNEEIPSQSIVPDSSFPVIYGEKGLLVFNLVLEFKNNLNDEGIEILEMSGGNRPNMVPDNAQVKIKATIPFVHILKAYNEEYHSNITIEYLDNNEYLIFSKGVSAHGSRPDKGVNAIAHLINFLDKIDLQIGDTSNFIRVISRHIGLEYNGENIGCAFEDIDSGKLTFNIGVVQINKDKGQLTCNIRYPITSKYEEVIEGIKNSLNYTNFEYIEEEHMKPLHIDKDSEFIQTLLKIYNDYTKRNDVPLTMGGATYARSMPNAISYGFHFPWQEELAHQKDEFISIDDLILSTKIYAKALYELAK